MGILMRSGISSKTSGPLQNSNMDQAYSQDHVNLKPLKA